MAVVYALLGDTAESKKLIDQLRATHPSDFLLQIPQHSSVQALNLLHPNKPAEAIAILEPSRQYELGTPLNLNTYLVVSARGLAYLQMRDGAKAACGAPENSLNSVSVDLAMAASQPGARLCDAGRFGQGAHRLPGFLRVMERRGPRRALLKEAKAQYAKLQ